MPRSGRSRPTRAAPAARGGGPEEDDPSRRLFLATLRVRIPPGIWTGRFSSGHPTIRLEVLNRGEISPGVSISDYWISGGPPGFWAEEIAGYPDVLRVDSLAAVGEGCLYRITYRDPPIVELYRRLELPVPFPIRMQAGSIDWEIAARYSEFDAVMRYARQRDPDARVISIKRRPLRNHLLALTEHQQTLLSEAMAAGYFAVPRGITLTALARKLHRSKSSISESIALIEQKLLESALRPPLARA
ncbi:MAG TPA: helix-turn-helix domain-containing protein [Thermoplasmata archaeon]|nr:helix-turn-helix domain-containing protein [Thermoplasmata archaeon]